MLKFTALSEHVTHHIKEEEGKMFPQAEKAELDWERLTTHVMQRRQSLEQKPLWLLGVPVIVREGISSVPSRRASFSQVRGLKRGQCSQLKLEVGGSDGVRNEYEIEPRGESG